MKLKRHGLYLVDKLKASKKLVGVKLRTPAAPSSLRKRILAELCTGLKL